MSVSAAIFLSSLVLKPAIRRSAALVLLAIIVYAAGPRHTPEFGIKPIPRFSDVDEYVTSVEANVPDVREGAGKVIRWARDGRSRTERAIVYIHGFSATRQEVAPLCDTLARRLDANLFYTRLKGHGRPAEAMGEATVGDWLFDVREALAVGRAIGDRVIVVGSSTGATLAVLAISDALTEEETDGVEAVVLLSPNFGPADRRANLLLMPWGRQLAGVLIGEYREWKPHNELQRRYWTTRYPVRALFPMMSLVDAVDRLDPKSVDTPVYVAYSPNDQVVSTSHIRDWYKSIAAEPRSLLTVPESTDPSGHILAGDILSPGTTERLATTIVDFLGSL